MMADREDLQLLTERPVNIIDQPGENAGQRVRSFGELGRSLAQLLPKRTERAYRRRIRSRSAHGRRAHDRSAIAWRPPSRKSVQAPPSLRLRGSTTPCQYLLRMARSSGARRASEPTSEPARVSARRVRSPKKWLCRMASSRTPICSAVERADSSLSSSLTAEEAPARRSAKLCSR